MAEALAVTAFPRGIKSDDGCPAWVIDPDPGIPARSIAIMRKIFLLEVGNPPGQSGDSRRVAGAILLLSAAESCNRFFKIFRRPAKIYFTETLVIRRIPDRLIGIRIEQANAFPDGAVAKQAFQICEQLPQT